MGMPCLTIVTDCIPSMEEGNVFTPVCHSVHRGVGAPEGRPHQKSDPPPHRRQTTLPECSQPGNAVNVRLVRIIPDCILVASNATELLVN